MASSTALHLSFGDGGFHALDNISLLGAGLPHVIIEKILASADTARLATLDIRGNEIDYQLANELARKFGLPSQSMIECNGLPIRALVTNEIRKLHLNGFRGRHPLFGIEAFGGHILASLLPGNTSLIEIDFRQNEIGLIAAAELGEACAKSQVRFVNRIGCRKRPGYGTPLDLRKLRMSARPKLSLPNDLVTDEEFAFLLAYLRDTLLVEIDVSHNAAITPAVCQCFLEYLGRGKTRTLRRLAFAGLSWDDASVVSLVDAIGHASLLELEELSLPLHCGLKGSTLAHVAHTIASCYPTITFGEACYSLNAIRLSNTLSLSIPSGASSAEFAVWSLILRELQPECLRQLLVVLDEASSSTRPPPAPSHHPLVYWAVLEALRALSNCKGLKVLTIAVHPSIANLPAVLVDSLEAAKSTLRELEISYLNYIDLPPSSTSPEKAYLGPSWDFLTGLLISMPCLQRLNGIPLPVFDDQTSQETRDVTKLIYYSLAIPNISVEHDPGAFCVSITLSPHFDMAEALVACLNLTESGHVLAVLCIHGKDAETQLRNLLKAIKEGLKMPRLGCQIALVLNRPVPVSAMESLYHDAITSGRVTGLPIFPDESVPALEAAVRGEGGMVLSLERLYITRMTGWKGVPLANLRKLLTCLCTPRHPFKCLHICYGHESHRYFEKSELIGMLHGHRLEDIFFVRKSTEVLPATETGRHILARGLKLSLDASRHYNNLTVLNLCNCNLTSVTLEDPLLRQPGAWQSSIYSTRWLEYERHQDEEELRGWLVQVLVNIVLLPSLESIDLRGNGFSVEESKSIWAPLLSGLFGRSRLQRVQGVAIKGVTGKLDLRPPEGVRERILLSSGDVWVYEKLIGLLRDKQVITGVSMQRFVFEDGDCSLRLLETILSGSVEELEIIDCLMGPRVSRSMWTILHDKLVSAEACLRTFNGITIDGSSVPNAASCSEWNDLSLALVAAGQSKGLPPSCCISGENITDFGLAKFAELVGAGSVIVPRDMNLEGSRYVTDWGVKTTVDTLISSQAAADELRSISFDKCLAINARSAFELIRAARSLPNLTKVNSFDLEAVRKRGELSVYISEERPLSAMNVFLASAVADLMHINIARVVVGLRRRDKEIEADCLMGQSRMLLESLPLSVATSVIIRSCSASLRPLSRNPHTTQRRCVSTSCMDDIPSVDCRSIEKQAEALWASIKREAGITWRTMTGKPRVIIDAKSEELSSLFGLSHGLSFEGVSTSSASLAELSRAENSSVSPLTHLSFCGSAPLGPDGMVPLNSFLCRSATNLVSLGLPGACLGDAGLVCLSEILTSLPLLRVLDIRQNSISSDGVTKLAQAFRTRPLKIEYIDLGENTIGPNGFMEMAELLSTSDARLANASLARNQILECLPSAELHLALESVSALVYGVAACDTLQVFDLRDIFNGRENLWHSIIQTTNADQLFDAKYLEAGLLVKRIQNGQ